MIRLRQNLMEMDAVIFDLGNVLLNYTPRRYLELLKIDPALHDRMEKALFGHPLWAEIDRGTMNNADLADAASKLAPDLSDAIHDYMENWVKFFYLIPENVDTFYRIKDTGTKVYILSNFSKENFEVMESRYPWLKDFDGRIISYREKLIKPDPPIYHLLIDRFKLNPSRSVFIDDLEANVQTAINVGLNAIWHDPGKPIAPYFVF